MTSTNLVLNKTCLIKLTHLSFWIWPLFFTLFWSRGHFFSDATLYARSLSNLTDTAAHLTYISNLATTNLLPGRFPLLPTETFIYPFLGHLPAAFLVKLGLNLITAYNLTGLFFSLLLCFFTYRVYRSFLPSRPMAIIAQHLFFLSGGLGFLTFIQDLNSHGLTLLTSLPREYTLLPDQNIRWLNIITGGFLPQRSLLVGFTVGLVIILNLRSLTQNSSLPRLYLTALLLGLLPLIHPHTLISLTPFLLFILPALARTYHRHFAAVTLLTLFLHALSYFHLRSPHLTFTPTLHLGWLTPFNPIPQLQFWWTNWGLFLPLALLGFALTPKPTRRLLGFTTATLFILVNTIQLQPNLWDNAKLLVWAYFFLAIPAAYTLRSLTHHLSIHYLLAALLFIIMTFSAGLDLIRQLQPSQRLPMFSPSDLALASFVRSHTSPSATFAIYPHFAHPIPTLTGRIVFLGYPGWLWSYGLNPDFITQRELELSQIYQGTTGSPELITRHHLNYLLIGPLEREHFHPNQAYFDTTFPKIYSSSGYELYALDRPFLTKSANP